MAEKRGRGEAADTTAKMRAALERALLRAVEAIEAEAGGAPEKTLRAITLAIKAEQELSEFATRNAGKDADDDGEAIRADIRRRLARFVAAHRSEGLSGKPDKP